MEILTKILSDLPSGKIIDVRLGLHWTAVVVEAHGAVQAGLASVILNPPGGHSQLDVPLAGKLAGLPALEVAGWAQTERGPLASLGVAAINALLPRQPESWKNGNAEEMIAARGQDKKVAIIGHFPFVDRLRSRVGELAVLELQPRAGDLQADRAGDILPQSEVIAITGMSLVNHTLPDLLALCPREAYVLLLGPSSPLSPVFYDYGIHLISGSIVEDIDAVLSAVSQGGNFRQIHKSGVRLVNIEKTG